jgi:hypothetical protein
MAHNAAMESAALAQDRRVSAEHELQVVLYAAMGHVATELAAATLECAALERELLLREALQNEESSCTALHEALCEARLRETAHDEALAHLATELVALERAVMERTAHRPAIARRAVLEREAQEREAPEHAALVRAARERTALEELQRAAQEREALLAKHERAGALWAELLGTEVDTRAAAAVLNEASKRGGFDAAVALLQVWVARQRADAERTAKALERGALDSASLERARRERTALEDDYWACASSDDWPSTSDEESGAEDAAHGEVEEAGASDDWYTSDEENDADSDHGEVEDSTSSLDGCSDAGYISTEGYSDASGSSSE